MEDKPSKIIIEEKELRTGTMYTTHYPAGFLHPTLPVTNSIIITDWKKWQKYMESMVTIP